MFEVLQETRILYPNFPNKDIDYVSNNPLKKDLLARTIAYNEKVFLLFPNGKIKEVDGVGDFLTSSWVSLKDLLILKNLLDEFDKAERICIYHYNLPPFCGRPGSLAFFTRD